MVMNAAPWLVATLQGGGAARAVDRAGPQPGAPAARRELDCHICTELEWMGHLVKAVWVWDIIE